jgi:hypothetical protein
VTAKIKRKRPAGSLTSMFIRGVPAMLKNAFKAYCVLNGVDMKDMIISFMSRTVKKEDKQ